MHIAIIGAGWAGLAAAVELVHRGHRVSVIEAARSVGGRARSVSDAGLRIDNGQHLLIGAYRQTRALLERIGVCEDAVFARRPLQLLLHDLGGRAAIDIRASRLPAPLHMLTGLATARGLTLSERWRALRLCAALPGLRPGTGDDTVAALLQRYRQPRRLVTALWEPLCLAIMNTPSSQASARVFIRVLQDSFLHQRHDSDLLLPRRDLGSVIPEPALDYIREHDGDIRLQRRVKALAVDKERVTAAVFRDGSRIEAEHFIVAMPAYACQRLLAPQPLFASLAGELDRFTYAPICTVYLQYPATVTVETPMSGMLGGLGQWLFDRRLCRQDGLMAVVISGHGPHEQLDNAHLAQRISDELATLYPAWPRPQRTFVIREKRATFVCDPDSDHYRPGHATMAANMWLAGDYTATGYPATLEGAIRSGRNCAAMLLSDAAPAPSV
jgi:squalene-associated FAD-dependent desaturase